MNRSDFMDKSYLIVIPAHNEEDNIEAVVNEVRQAQPAADVLVVNDGSTDRTSELAALKGAMVLDIPVNIGYGCAVQTGFRFAVDQGYEFVAMMDGDAQHDPSSLSALIAVMERERADVVIGSRFFEGTYKMPLARKIGVWLFSAIAHHYTKMTFTDPTSGFQLLNRKVFSYLSLGDNYPLDYPDVNIIMALHKMNFKVREAPVKMRERAAGKSMHSGLRPIIYTARMFLAIIMVLLRKED